MMLQIRNVSKHFGGLKAVDKCSLGVEEKSITGLIGPNGAGKTTLFNVITGFLPISGGRIRFEGKDITGVPTYGIAREGLVRTFQTAAGFMQMTVLENLIVAPQNQEGEGVFRAIFKTKSQKKEQKQNKQKALRILNTLDLYKKKDEWVQDLSGGEIKLLEVGRQLMTNSKMLLLDEPMSGVNPGFQVRMLKYLRGLRNKGLTFFIIEHNLSFIMSISDTVYVMDSGQLIAQGTPEEIRKDEKVITAYLGGEEK